MPDATGKPFIHEDKELFSAALVLAEDRLKNVGRALIEKDYWVTHTLDALKRAGFTVYFKGGTSLSKGFALIERFSEDLDLKLEGDFLPAELTKNAWNGREEKHRAKRRAFFDAILSRPVGDLKLVEEPSYHDEHLRNFGIAVHYPRTVSDVPAIMKDYVLLEVGRARVTPYVECALTSWVHTEVRARGSIGAFANNEPTIRCVHPLVTLLEKLNALAHRSNQEEATKPPSAEELAKRKEDAEREGKPGTDVSVGVGGVLNPPSLYIRHYEDTARLIRAHADGNLPALSAEFPTVRSLADALVTSHDINRLPSAKHLAFQVDGRMISRAALEKAHSDLDAYFWGARTSLDECCALVRDFIIKNGLEA